jgi:hypothetical protein
MDLTKVKAYMAIKEELQMLKRRSTPLKQLLILQPKMPFESYINFTKETWACEHPKVTMVFI